MIEAETDLTCVWVHDRGECVARFGRIAYEVFSRETPRRLLAYGRSATTASWLDFKAKVMEVHRLEIGIDLTPIRFHDEFGFPPWFGADEPIFMIPIGKLAVSANPFVSDVWGRGRITRLAVRTCVDAGDLARDFVDMGIRHTLPPGWDARRIAFFVACPDARPISVEVLSPDGSFCIHDGCHRLAAALYRGDRMIAAALGGYVDGFEVAFPDRVPVIGNATLPDTDRQISESSPA